MILLGPATRELLALAYIFARPDFPHREQALHSQVCSVSSVVPVLYLVSPEGEPGGCSLLHTQLLHPLCFHETGRQEFGSWLFATYTARSSEEDPGLVSVEGSLLILLIRIRASLVSGIAESNGFDLLCLG